MNKEDFNHSKIIKIEPYQNYDDRWLFNLTYELWDDDGNVAALNVPCVESPFLNCAGMINVYKDRYEEIEIRDGLNNVIQRNKYGETYKAYIRTQDKVDIYAANNPSVSTEDKYFYTIKIIKRAMTIDDIKKALGYEVEIVDE